MHLNFTSIQELTKRFPNNLDWNMGINAMLVIKVNMGTLELLE